MDVFSTLIAAALFYAFVPGVLFRLPAHGSSSTVFIVHAILFAIVSSIAMKFYWHRIRGFAENMGNYGAKCPNGYIMKPDESCVPVGHRTY